MAKISLLPVCVALDGSEHIPVVQQGTTKRTTMASFRDLVTPYLQNWYKGDTGDTGASDNTYTNYAALLASDPLRKVARLVGDAVEPDGNFSFRGGTWTRQAARGITFKATGDGAVTRDLETKGRELVSVADFGAACDGVTDDSAAIALANAVAGKRPLHFNGVCYVAAPVTITAPIARTMAQIFTIDAKVTIDNHRYVRPEWFGVDNMGAFDAAAQSLPQPRGGVVRLENRRYKPSGYAFDEHYMARENIAVFGGRAPRYADDCRSLIGGSVIEGMFLAYANGFKLRNVGIDCGLDVLNAYYEGVEQAGVTEALNITYPTSAIKAASELRRGINLTNVVTLSSSPGAPTHSAIVGEGVTDVVINGKLTGCYGVHGIVIKCANVQADKLASYCNKSEAVIIKSDVQETARATAIDIASIVTSAGAPPGTFPAATAIGLQQYGLLFLALGGDIDGVQIGMVRSSGATVGIGTDFQQDFAIASVKIGSAIIDQEGAAGTRIGLKLLGYGVGGGRIQRFRIDSLECRNTTAGVQAIFSVGPNRQERASIGHLTVVKAQGAIDIGNSAYLDVGMVVGEDLTGGLYRITGTPSLLVGGHQVDATVPTIFNPLAGALVPVIGAGWTQFPKNDPFVVDLVGYGRELSGLVRPNGTTNRVCTLPQFAWPASTKRFYCAGQSGGVATVVPVVVGSDGSVLVNEVAGGTANCSDWLSLAGIRF